MPCRPQCGGVRSGTDALPTAGVADRSPGSEILGNAGAGVRDLRAAYSPAPGARVRWGRATARTLARLSRPAELPTTAAEMVALQPPARGAASRGCRTAWHISQRQRGAGLGASIRVPAGNERAPHTNRGRRRLTPAIGGTKPILADRDGRRQPRAAPPPHRPWPQPTRDRAWSRAPSHAPGANPRGIDAVAWR